ncbi:MAG: hypothetical protein AB1567_00105 [bacterium]
MVKGIEKRSLADLRIKYGRYSFALPISTISKENESSGLKYCLLVSGAVIWSAVSVTLHALTWSMHSEIFRPVWLSSLMKMKLSSHTTRKIETDRNIMEIYRN